MAALADFARLRRVVPAIRVGLSEKRLISHASAISYQLLFGLVPLALAALALLSFLQLEEVWRAELRPQARDHLSPAAFRLLDGTADQILTSKRTLWLTFGSALALWKLSAAARVTMDALDELHDIARRRSFVRRLATSLGLAVAAAACLVSAALIVAAGGRAAVGDVPAALSFALRWGAAVALMLAAVWLILRFAPSERQPLRWVSAGSVFVTVGWVGASLAFGVYAAKIASLETLFGGLTAVIILMLYLYVSSITFLVGAYADIVLQRDVDGPSPEAPTRTTQAPTRTPDAREARPEDAPDRVPAS